MAEPVLEQLAARVKTELQAIVGDGGATYWYTPATVRWAEFNDGVKWDTTGEVFFEVRLGERELEARTTRQRHNVRSQIVVTAARRDKRHNVADSDLRTVKERLAQDVRRKLAGWPTWGGGLGLHRFEPTEEEHDVKASGWVAVHIHFAVEQEARFAA